jgi:hypothetical protein
MFDPKTVKARIRKQPFVPVRIVTSSGEAYEVHHPDLIMIGRTELVIGLAGKKKPEFYDDLARVALMHVTALEDLHVSSKPKGNGQQ